MIRLNKALMRLVLTALAVALAPAAAQARWLRGESAHFVVYSNSGEKTLRDYVQHMEDYDRLLRKMHSGASFEGPVSKLEIYMVGGPGDLRQVFPEMNRDWAGVYTAGPDGIFAVAFKPSALYGYQIVKHEYYHHFMLQNFPGGYPGWLVEGLAEFFSSSERRNGKLIVGDSAPGRIDALAEQGWMPISLLISKGPFEVSPEYLQRYYAEAWLLTDYMMTDPARKHQLNDYVIAVRNGADPLKAWTEKVGISPDNMKSALLAFRLTGFVADSSPPPQVPIEVTALPESADDLLLESLQLKHGTPRAQLLTKARIDADPGDTEARLILAKALMKQADADKVIADRRLELYREADRALVPALKADPDDVRVLYLYAQSRSVEPDYPSENIVRALIKAVDLAPQVDEFRFAAADAAATRGDIDLAITELSPLASDPHAMQAARHAKARIEELEKRKAAVGAKTAG